MKKILVVISLFSLAIGSRFALATAEGSLRTMLETNITLMEYIEIKTGLESLERMTAGRVTKWGEYSSVVKLRARLGYGHEVLRFHLEPLEDYSFSTIADAKSYCRDLIRAENRSVWILLLGSSTPNGWSNSKLGADDFYKRLFISSEIRVIIEGYEIAEVLPEQESYLICDASLDEKGNVEKFSYNI